MPRVVQQTLWFEDVSIVHQPVIDTPLGRLSLRQMAGLGLSALLGYLASLLLADLIFKVAAGAIAFLPGAIIVMQPVRTVAPERYLLLMFGLGVLKPRRAKPGRAGKGKGGVKAEPVKGEVKVMRVSATLEAPIKIVGVLRDPSTGELLAERGFDFLVDGEYHSSGVTDEEGFFTVFFAPKRYGVYRVEVRPEGYAGSAQEFEVHVEPKGGVKVA